MSPGKCPDFPKKGSDFPKCTIKDVRETGIFYLIKSRLEIYHHKYLVNQVSGMAFLKSVGA